MAAVLSSATTTTAPSAPTPLRLVTCGDAVVRLYQLRSGTGLALDGVWTAAVDVAIPRDLVASFSTVSECKPVDGGRTLLIASSHDGVALVDLATRQSTFHASVGHAHSGDVSPDGLVLIAGAEGERGGNVLALFDRRVSGERLATIPLAAAHGVVYDPARRAFWALGGDELLLVRGERRPVPRLVVEDRVPLPSRVGHDLSWWGAHRLSVTTDKGAYIFSPTSRTFRVNPAIRPGDHVKSVSWSGAGPILWVRADDAPAGVWWSHALRLSGAAPLLVGERSYKARWLVSRLMLRAD